jgi:cation diffusion facilitator family transporter
MSASGGAKAILAAFLANMGIALAKFIAWFLSGSASMLAEAIHSVADSGNQLLLMLGGRKAKKRADREHPFGYGRERYVYAFVVSIILFSVGGLFAIYEGVDKLRHPHALDERWWWLPIVVLVVAIGLESFSLRTAIRESNLVRREGESWVAFVRHAKAPELPVVLLEDVGALTGLCFALFGVGMTVITGDPVFDAIGTLMIGTLLVLIAIVLGIETKSLLVGEGANEADHAAIRAAIEGGDASLALIHIKTLYLGPDELLVAAKLGFEADAQLADVAARIDAVEARVRAAVPAARVLYFEPDIYRRDEKNAPSSAADSASHTPPTTSAREGSRRSRTTS